MLKYSIDFINGAKINIDHDNINDDYDIIFKDKDTNNITYSVTLRPGSWAKTNEIYFKNWNIQVYNKKKLLLDYNIDLKYKNVFITMESKSLGDTLAWIPYVEEFRKKHNCNVYLSTFLNYLFEEQYKNINFVKPGGVVNNLYAMYRLGWFVPYENKNPQDYKKIPMQQTASDILGLEYKEIKPLIEKFNIKEKATDYKYVCIAEFSTANCKHWHYPIINSNLGWQKIVDWLNYNGYKVMVISKQHTDLKNVIDRTGNFPLDFRIYELQNCEFVISIGSGLSWLAWALNKKVVMISGFSDPICEFKEDNIRIINKNVCNSCFNKHTFDKGDWNWCPINKNTDKHFECTTSITPEMVASKIKENNLIIDKGGFNFNIINKDSLNDKDIILFYDNNKINIKYNNNEPLKNIHVNIRNDENKIIRTIKNIELNKNFINWSLFENNQIKKFNIEFFNDYKILLQKELII